MTDKIKETMKALETLEEAEAKMSETALLKVFRLNCENFGFEAAMKGFLMFMDDIDDVFDDVFNEKKAEE